MRRQQSVGDFLPLTEQRRDGIRFPIKSDLRWTVVNGKNGSLTGTGETVDFASTGISFRSDGKLPLGSRLKIDVDWPVELDGRIPMKLLVQGTVIRVNGPIVFVTIEKREFRTAGRKANQRVV
jgi:hypothetical protein